jgi:excisionase family DNA binding protein
MERRTSRSGGEAGGGLEWLTLGQAATYLGVAQSTVRKWSDSGRLTAFYTEGLRSS